MTNAELNPQEARYTMVLGAMLRRMRLGSEQPAEMATLSTSALTSSAVEALSTHSSPDVRAELAAHEAVPAEVLDVLARDKDPEVRLAAAWPLRQGGGRHLLGDVDERVRAVAAYAHAAGSSDLELLEVLAQHPDTSVRRVLAANPAVTDEILEGLDLSDDMVARYLTQNPNVRLEALGKVEAYFVLERIEEGDEEGVVEGILAENPARGLVELLLPHWEGTFGSLLAAAEMLAAHPSRDMAEALVREWEGTFEEMMAAVEALDGDTTGTRGE